MKKGSYLKAVLTLPLHLPLLYLELEPDAVPDQPRLEPVTYLDCQVAPTVACHVLGSSLNSLGSSLSWLGSACWKIVGFANLKLGKPQ